MLTQEGVPRDGDCSCQYRRHGVADLSRHMQARSGKHIPVWKRLNARCLTQGVVAKASPISKSILSARDSVDSCLYCLGRPIELTPTMSFVGPSTGDEPVMVSASFFPGCRLRKAVNCVPNRNPGKSVLARVNDHSLRKW